ncbi:hypothetical protein HMI56_004776 [Coelomomyces lativittatus]|nr:hypothetical protein HMI56_004776 [Coelomomyces lativittatus]
MTKLLFSFSNFLFTQVPSPSVNRIRQASVVATLSPTSKHYSPAVAHLLRKHRIPNPESIPRTGKQGRLLKSDVLGYVQSRSIPLSLVLPRYCTLNELHRQLQDQWKPSVPIMLDHTFLTTDTGSSPLKFTLHSVDYVKKPLSSSVPIHEQTSLPFFELLAGVHRPSQPCTLSTESSSRHLFEELVAWPSESDHRFLPVLNLEIVVPSSCSDVQVKEATSEILAILKAVPYASSS